MRIDKNLLGFENTLFTAFQDTAQPLAFQFLPAFRIVGSQWFFKNLARKRRLQ
jgi:hypothetical protein